MTGHCQHCGATEDVRRLQVVNPNGEIDVCPDCEDDLRATVVQVVSA